MNNRQQNGCAVLWLAICAALAFALRALPWRNFLGPEGKYLFYGPDSYDHLRRITLGISAFPHVPTFDSYYGYPVGTGQIWSPLFDYLISILSLVAGGRSNSDITYAIGFWLSPVLAAATVFLVYTVGKRMFGRTGGLASAFIIAVLPGHILYSFASELDHHVAEPMVCLGIIASLLKWEEANNRDWWQRSGWIFSGFWFVFALLIWRGSVIFLGVAFLAIAAHVTASAIKGKKGGVVAFNGIRAALIAALLLTPICLFNVWGGTGGINFGIISWFHVVLLLVMAAIVFLLDRCVPVKPRSLLVICCSIVVLAGLYLLTPVGRRFIAEFGSGLSVLSGGDPWLDSISELRPMLFPQGKLDIWHATETLSLLYWLFPLLLVPLFSRWKRSGYQEFGSCVALSLFVTFWTIPLFRERYVHLAAVAMALGGGFLLTLVAERIVAQGNRMRSTLLAGGLTLLLLAPVSGFLYHIPQMGLAESEQYDLPLALGWLRDMTPQTSFYADPVRVPEYGVLADWGLGAYIDQVAQRPTIATNFGWETHGLYESAAYLTLIDPLAAETIVRENRVRYLFLNQITGSLPQLRRIAEFGAARGKYPGGSLPSFLPLETMYYRLYIQGGSAYDVAGKHVGALGNYRLLFDSPHGFIDPVAGAVGHYRIFERVAGAVIKGMAPAGSAVGIRLNLHGVAGRIFTYRDSTVTNGEGLFMFRVPYATDRESGDFVPESAYLIETYDSKVAVRVTDREVVAGSDVVVR